MGLREIPKFCDATLEKVLNEVSVIVCVARYKLKDPPLGELDKDIMELFETEIKKRLKHQRQMRRVKQIGQPWSTAINGGQQWSTVVKLAENLLILPEAPKNHSPDKMGRTAVALIVSSWVIPISILVNHIVPKPYMDEIFHVPQARQYCAGNFTTWDPMITTPPGFKMVKDMEVHFDMTVRHKTAFGGLCTPHAQDFLLAIPIDGFGQHMSPVEYRTILKYHLMILLFSVDAICPVCRKACLDSFGEHTVHCKELTGFKYLHDMVRNILFDICRRAGISAKKEAPVKFLTDLSDGRSTLRLVDVLVFG
ncbi:putative reverse transcriptase domain-containing protein [Tanacetum coccineum]